MYCTRCGKELPEGAKFCQGCGAKIEKEISFADVKTFAGQKAQQAAAGIQERAKQASANIQNKYQEFREERERVAEDKRKEILNQQQITQNTAQENEPVNVPPNNSADIQGVSQEFREERERVAEDKRKEVFNQQQITQNTAQENEPVNVLPNNSANVPPNGYANYYANMPVQIPPEYQPISMWGYFGYQILFMIPIIGFILLLVFAFGGTQNKNLKNFARSYFCTTIIVVVILLCIAFFAWSANF